MRSRVLIRAVLIATVGLLLAGGTASAAKKKRPPCQDGRQPSVESLPSHHRQWTEEVALLLSDEEIHSFLCLSQDYQRDAFIAEFWKARDPYPDTARNEFREHWIERLSMVRQLFENTDDERARYYLLNGPPGVHVEICPRRSATSIEAWFYGFEDLSQVMGAIFSRRLRQDQYAVIFYRRLGVGPWRAWYPSESLSTSALQPGGRLDLPGAGIGGLRREDLGAGCKEEELGYALQIIRILNDWGGMLGFFYERMIGEKLEPIEAPSDEWLRTFESYSTDLPSGAPELAAALDVSFPGRKESRTVVQTLVQVEPEGATLADLAGARSYAFELIGEVLRADAVTSADRLFESFRYRFEFPVEGDEASGETQPAMPLVAQRYLRPGDYKLILRVDDLNGDAVWRHAEPLEVPRVEQAAGWTEADLEPIFAEANRSLASGEPTIRIIPPGGELVSGYLRFDTAVTGPVDKVRFTLDDKDLFTTKRAPYSVDVRLGELPRSQMLRAIAFDLEGNQIASDSYLINGSPHRFDVRIIEPIPGNQYSKSVRLRAQVTVPEGRSLEELQVFRNADQVATLYEEPFTVPVELPGGRELAIIRIVGKLLDAEGPASFVEDTAIINGPATLEEVQVDFVELYTTVDDRDRRPLLDLGEDAFQVLEDGVAQEILRFERVDDTPLVGTILLDVSASMEERLAESVKAAADFFQQVITERDELSIVTFNDRPHLASPFTRDRIEFAKGLMGLRAERGTALYDSLIFTLYHLNGLPGQRAVLLLSDGVDEHSRYDLDDALEYARRSEAAIYAIGLALPKKAKESPKKVLEQLALETGGRAFFVENTGELAAVYDQIGLELRSKYFLAYQSSSTAPTDAFRRVEVVVDERGARARTIRGYYP